MSNRNICPIIETYISENNIRWKYYNYLGNERIGSIHWSRYLDKNTNFDWIESFNCN